jgi:hypothetical protein
MRMLNSPPFTLNCWEALNGHKFSIVHSIRSDTYPITSHIADQEDIQQVVFIKEKQRNTRILDKLLRQQRTKASLVQRQTRNLCARPVAQAPPLERSIFFFCICEYMLHKSPICRGGLVWPSSAPTRATKRNQRVVNRRTEKVQEILRYSPSDSQYRSTVIPI